MHMRDTARASIFSLPHNTNALGGNSARSTVYSSGEDEPSASSPMLQPGPGRTGSHSRASALRHSTMYAEESEGDGSDSGKEGEDEGLRHRGHATAL